MVVSGDNARLGDAEVAWPRIIEIQAIAPESNSIKLAVIKCKQKAGNSIQFVANYFN